MRPSAALKLSEAEFFLNHLGGVEGRQEFRFCISAFLNAFNGFLDVMRTEYDSVSGFGSWYKSAIAMRKGKGGDLYRYIKWRNLAQHREGLRLRPVLEKIKFIPDPHPNPRRPRFRDRGPTPGRSQIVMPGMQRPQQYAARWYFAGDRTDAWSRCDWCLEQLKAIAADCSARFG